MCAIMSNINEKLEGLCEALKLDDNKCFLMKDVFYEILSEAPSKTRRKRAPSEYNKFIGKCIRSRTGPITSRMKECASEWKERKNNEKIL